MLTDDRPGLVRYGLASQIRDAGVDIPSNIARGCGGSGNDGAQRWYFNAAIGSAASLEYLVLLASELGLIPDDEHEWFTVMAVDIQKMLRVMVEENETERRNPASLTLVQ
jgi:four helix bundle protein